MPAIGLRDHTDRLHTIYSWKMGATTMLTQEASSRSQNIMVHILIAVSIGTVPRYCHCQLSQRADGLSGAQGANDLSIFARMQKNLMRLVEFVRRV